jgi:hypothetical protein
MFEVSFHIVFFLILRVKGHLNDLLIDDYNFKRVTLRWLLPTERDTEIASPAYGVYISQLIRYAKASSNYSDFLTRHPHLRNRILDQGYEKIRLIRSLKKFIFRYQDLVEIYSVSAEKIINDGFSYCVSCAYNRNKRTVTNFRNKGNNKITELRVIL